MRLRFYLQSLAGLCVALGAMTPLLAQQLSLVDHRQLQEVVDRQEARLQQLEAHRLPPIDGRASYYNVATNAAVESRLADVVVNQTNPGVYIGIEHHVDDVVIEPAPNS